MKYVERSIQSIVGQTFQNYECIIIDDGSRLEFQHHSYYQKICNDKRFKFIYHANIGLGQSRNVGINEATGDYIMFLDGDDYYRNDALFFINESFNEYKADALHFNYKIIKKHKSQAPAVKNEKLFFKWNSNNEIKLSYFKQIQGNCKFAFDLKFLRDNKLYYYKQNIIHEDVYFCMLFKTVMKNIIFSENEIYFYDTTRQTSITNTDSKNNYITFINNIELAYIHLKKNNLLNEMFSLYSIYYLNKFIGNKYKSYFADEIFKNNKFIINKIGISRYHILMFFCYRHKFIGKFVSMLMNNKFLLKIAKLIFAK